MGFYPLQRAPAELIVQCSAPNSTTGRRDAACLQHQLGLLIAEEGLTPLTELIRQRRLHSSVSSYGGREDLKQMFQNCQREADISFPSLPNGERQQIALQNLSGS